jgi:hypothetical protein
MVVFEHECASHEHLKLSRFNDFHMYSICVWVGMGS